MKLKSTATTSVIKKASCMTALVLSLGVAFSAQAAEKPDFWPKQYKWHEYSKTAPQPVYNGKIKFTKKEGWGEAVNFNTLPLQHAIVRVRGNGKRKMAVFVDPTCPHAVRMEKAIKNLDNVTIYTFVVPTLDRKESYLWSDHIACAGNNQEKAQAYEELMIAGMEPLVVAPCKSGIDKVLSSIDGLTSPVDGKVFSNTSPVTVTGNNIIISGYFDTPYIEDLFLE